VFEVLIYAIGGNVCNVSPLLYGTAWCHVVNIACSQYM
jgi:hypothetical protein